MANKHCVDLDTTPYLAPHRPLRGTLCDCLAFLRRASFARYCRGAA